MPLPGETPVDYALRAAKAKALSILPHIPEHAGRAARPFRSKPCGPVVIAADTIVVLEGRILGKPVSPEGAYAMLRALAGRSHSVFTGCVLLRPGADTACLARGGEVHPPQAADPAANDPAEPFAGYCLQENLFQYSFAVESRVRMWAAPAALLHAYAFSGEPLDKAGAYAVQGTGAFLVESIEGSWSNVVGLPLAELVRELMKMGCIAPFAPHADEVILGERDDA